MPILSMVDSAPPTTAASTMPAQRISHPSLIAPLLDAQADATEKAGPHGANVHRRHAAARWPSSSGWRMG
jgi:hypothetical protein